MTCLFDRDCRLVEPQGASNHGQHGANLFIVPRFAPGASLINYLVFDETESSILVEIRNTQFIASLMFEPALIFSFFFAEQPNCILP